MEKDPLSHQYDRFTFKPLSFPPSPLDFLGVSVLLIMVILANAGGLGGGGILIPFMMLFFQFSIFESVPMANVFGMLAALTRFIVNYRQKHPNPQKAKEGRLSIDYEVIQITMPLLYLGTLFGVHIGTYLNEWQLAVCLSCVMFFVTYKTTQKAIGLYRQESEKKRIDTLIKEDNDEASQELNDLQDNRIRDIKPAITQEMKVIIENESRHFPLRRTFNFAVTLVLLFSTTILLGNKHQAPIAEPIIGYLMLTVFLIYTLGSTYWNALQLRSIHRIKRAQGYLYDPADLTFDDNSSILRLVVYCFFAGILGGIVGIAGGIILGPLFLSMGMLPVVVASTNQYLALISTISVSSQFIYMGILNVPYTAFLGPFVLLGSYIGLTQVNRIVKVTGRQSVIVITLAIVLGISAVSLPLRYLMI